MLGQIVEWFYGDLAGIRPDPAGPGFAKIIIKPAIVGGLTAAGARYDSVRGRIASRWQRVGATLTPDVTIPPNTTATVWVPTSAPKSILESGRPAAQSPGVRFLRTEAGAGVYQIASGQYVFASGRM